MIPAAVWSGIQAPECECATGEHRFFCPHMLAAIAGSTKGVADADSGDACRRQTVENSCCASAVPTSGATGPTSGATGLQNSSSGPCGQCKAVPSSTSKAVDRLEAPQLEHTAWFAPSPESDQRLLQWTQANDLRLPASDRLPMTDRVILLCCLLI
jgi:hypothetical protein